MVLVQCGDRAAVKLKSEYMIEDAFQTYTWALPTYEYLAGRLRYTNLRHVDANDHMLPGRLRELSRS